MKTNWKRPAVSLVIAAIAIMAGCKKDTPQPSTNTSAANTDNYSSLADFFAKNGPQMQTYTINGATGGSFTTPQGTKVTIPANAFYNNLYQIVTGPVTITFKDIYKKSDMLLSNITTVTTNETPLVSGGEFYIQATAAGSPLQLANQLTITQPLNGAPPDPNMMPYIKAPDTLPHPLDTAGWSQELANDVVSADINSYIFTLSRFNPMGGIWCNSDETNYFSAYTQAVLTAHETDSASNYGTQVYIIFKGINTTCACHTLLGDNFNYSYVPEGMQCTIVAIGIKNGKVYSSLTTLTLSANQTVNFSMTETTTAAFEAALNALN